MLVHGRLFTRQDMRWIFWAACIALIGTFAALAHAAPPAQQVPLLVTMHGYPSQPDELTLTIADAEFVVEGVIEVVEPARWTTADGKAPQRAVQALRDGQAQVRTPMRLAVDKVYKGTHVPAQLVFSRVGGLTPEVHLTEDGQLLKQGDRVLMFVGRGTDPAQAWTRISPYYPLLFYTVEGDTLHGPVYDVSRAAIISQLEGVQK